MIEYCIFGQKVKFKYNVCVPDINPLWIRNIAVLPCSFEEYLKKPYIYIYKTNSYDDIKELELLKRNILHNPIFKTEKKVLENKKVKIIKTERELKSNDKITIDGTDYNILQYKYNIKLSRHELYTDYIFTNEDDKSFYNECWNSFNELNNNIIFNNKEIELKIERTRENLKNKKRTIFQKLFYKK